MEYRFYQLTKSTLPEAITVLAQKAIGQGHNVHGQNVQILCKSAERMADIDRALWEGAEFLPHSTERFDGVSHIAITQTPLDSAEISFIVDDCEMNAENSQLNCFVFHSLDLDVVNLRRASWQNLKQNGAHLTYWSQDENGHWKVSGEANKRS